eukprot:3832666-Pyramimonas_sp.AAC.1
MPLCTRPPPNESSMWDVTVRARVKTSVRNDWRESSSKSSGRTQEALSFREKCWSKQQSLASKNLRANSSFPSRGMSGSTRSARQKGHPE